MSSGNDTFPPVHPTTDRMVEMSAQLASNAQNAAEAQARYFNSANAFNIKLPQVPSHAFNDAAAKALTPGMPTGWYDCDQSEAMKCDFPATSPLILARYARINAGQQLNLRPACSGVICFVIQGEGHSRTATETLHWQPGDVLLFAGGQNITLSTTETATDAVLWVVTDEPLYTLCQAIPCPENALPTVHYRNVDIESQLQLIQHKTPEATTSGCAVVFSSAQLEDSHNLLPTLTLSLNSLRSQCDQQPHRHNSAAITLVVSGDDCHTTIDGQPVPWLPWSTLVTPATAAHSHHNRGNQLARFLIVQDGGLYYHARTMGFQFLG